MDDQLPDSKSRGILMGGGEGVVGETKAAHHSTAQLKTHTVQMKTPHVKSYQFQTALLATSRR